MDKCNICKGDLKDRESYDLWLAVTRYDENGDVVKTGSDPGGEFMPDYVVVCDRAGCRQVVKTLWSRLTNTLTLGGDKL